MIRPVSTYVQGPGFSMAPVKDDCCYVEGASPRDYFGDYYVARSGKRDEYIRLIHTHKLCIFILD